VHACVRLKYSPPVPGLPFDLGTNLSGVPLNFGNLCTVRYNRWHGSHPKIQNV